MVQLSEYDHLVKEWHPTLNGISLPKDFTYGSNKKVWWKCQKNSSHIWIATVCDRTHGRGCPYCRGLKVNFTNCLATLNPQLSKEWHPVLNDKLTPNDVVINSHKKVWWICQKQPLHEWEAVIASRHSGKGCPYCTNRLPHITNCLSTTHPDLAKEFHPTKNGSLTPYNIIAGTGTKYWWQCQKNPLHIWKCSGANRLRGNNCPYCSHQRVCLDNCLATTHPDLAKEFHPTKNGSLTPYNIIAGTNKKIWWRCKRNPSHVWLANGGNRVALNRGCPYCNNHYKETKIYNIIKKILPDAKHKDKKLHGLSYNHSGLNMELDIFVPSLDLAIEVQGPHHYRPVGYYGKNLQKSCKNYQYAVDRDDEKRKACVERGISLVEINLEEWDGTDQYIYDRCNAKLQADGIIS